MFRAEALKLFLIGKSTRLPDKAQMCFEWKDKNEVAIVDPHYIRVSTAKLIFSTFQQKKQKESNTDNVGINMWK